MELSATEYKGIQAQVKEWLDHPEHELETTFGTIDTTTFLSVAKRLKARGYTSLPQGDSMTVMTKENIRFTLSGLGIIQQYCRDDVMAGKPYAAMIKDRSVATRNIDVAEYNFRIKARREIPMATDDASVNKLLEDWGQLPKAFRMIRRWTFEGDGVRVDMSIVRSTKKLPGGAFKWQKKFRDQEIMQAPPTYEIEVELMRVAGDTEEKAVKRLIRGVGEILRGIQKNVLLIRSSTVKKVLDTYKVLNGSDRFRGPAPRTLQKKNFMTEREAGEANIRDGYNVTDKADGLRCLGFCDEKGELFLIDMSMRNVYRTGLEQPECRLSLLDGEWVTLTKDKDPINQFLAFDIFYAVDKKDVSQFPFQPVAEDQKLQSRYGQLEKWMVTWNKGEGAKQVAAGLTPTIRLQVSMKNFLFASVGTDSIFRQAARVLDTARIYYTDGLIFTPNTKPLPAASAATFYDQFKWKPPKDNTVDFLVKFQKAGDTKQDKVIVGVKPGTEETVNYKTLRLFVGSSSENPRTIILNQQELPKLDRVARGAEIKGDYKPVLFTPKEFPDPTASYCNLPIFQDPDTGESYVKTHDTEEPILDKTIVEMAYDPKQPAGWRWSPLRVRNDKTERFQSGVIGRTLNSDKVADDVWDSIYDPITTHMIKSGASEPNEEEQRELLGAGTSGEVTKAYYDRKKAPVQDHLLTRTMRDFHNKYIKERILYRVGLNGTGKTLIDMACGVGADLGIWVRNKVSFVLGIDYSGPNITGERDGIYRRYMERLATAGTTAGAVGGVPPMVFAIGNSVKNYVTGAAGTTEEEKNIMRSVLGRVKPTGVVPPYIEAVGASRLKMKADCMSCMFAIHYFFETRETFSGFLKNVSENLKVGGYFIGCCFDGQKVFDLLRSTPSGSSEIGTEKNATIWSITKQYEEDDMPTGEDSFGLAIDVNFVTIGTDQREYLVNFDTLKEGMSSIGCELLDAKAAASFRLSESSATFGPTWEVAKKAGQTYMMPEAVKKFSFMNRWFIFQRKQEVATTAAATIGLQSMKERVANSMGIGMSTTSSLGLEQGEDGEEGEQGEQGEQGEEEDTLEGQKISISSTSTKSTLAPVVDRTLPVAKGIASPEAQTYASGELFQFYSDAADKDFLQIGDKGAGKWLSPTAPFPIQDPLVDSVKYPTMNHYLAAMRYRVASNTPDIATTVFGREGIIHQKFTRMRVDESDGGKKPIPEKRDQKLLKEEDAAVKEEIRPAAFKRHHSKFDEAVWASKKDEILEEGLRQRWETDARFRKIVEAARDKGKTLLYYAPGANSSNLGGVHRSTGAIEGDNRIGKILMGLAGF